MDKKIVRLRIRELLAERGMSGRELAEKMEVSPAYVSNIVNGGKSVSINSLTAVAIALDVDFVELFEKGAVTQRTRCPHCGKEIRVSFHSLT